MLISENILRAFSAFGFLYLFIIGSTNEEINCIDLFLKNSYGMIIIFIIMYSISYISYKLLGTKVLGLGDIKMSSISTIWLGLKFSLISLSISFILSALYSLQGKLAGKFYKFQQYPFAPFLSIGIFSSWILDKI
tara:strand:- start:408 stop:812 length:405 start_codon:yes stop_codon:yes gene_type:complete